MVVVPLMLLFAVIFFIIWLVISTRAKIKNKKDH